MDQARSHLGDATALAPRVVEGAVVRAWHERKDIDSQEALDAFLREDVQHRSARALSRRAAAHRMGHYEGSDAGGNGHGRESGNGHGASVAVPSREESWEHVLRGVQGTSHSASAHAEAHLHSRHDAAEHVKAIAAPRSWKAPVLGGVALLLVIAAGVFWIDRLGRDSAIVRAVNAEGGRAVTTNVGEMAMVTLDDGTRVRLAPDATITIPKAFGPDLRAVKLNGAADFQVGPGEGDFRVVARDAVILATGTRFTVYAYEADEAATIVVQEGSVRVRTPSADTPLAAGAALVSDASGLRPATAGEVEEATAWTQQRLAIINRPLSRVLPQIRRMYATDIRVQDAGILARPVTVRASLDSLTSAIAAVESSAKVKFGWAGQNMIFENAAPVVQAGEKTP
jgi:transmembrane sensor